MLVTAAIYAPLRNYGFVSWDDPLNVSANRIVRAGLTWEGIRSAATSTFAANWHPLTWISHMLDVSLFGVDPGAHHAVNVLLHVVNALLLFGFLK